MTNPIIEKRHAAYDTPAHIIFGLIKKATNHTPESSQKIVKGYDNEVYAVKTRQAETFILRISRHGKTDFGAEAWALEKCRMAGAPVPEVCWLDRVDIEGRARWVMVQRKLPGKALSEIQSALSPSTLRQIFHQAGALLSQINSIPVQGFYKRQGEGRWDFPDWDSLMTSALRDRAAEKAYILRAGFTGAEFMTMLTWLARYKEDFPCRQPVLCHGDFSSDHLFVDETMNISGLMRNHKP